MKNLRVIFLSQWINNPYSNLLASHLSSKEVQVEESRQKRSIFFPTGSIFFPLVIWQEKPDILHLHLFRPFIISRNQLFRWIRLFVFISQVFILKLLGTKTVWTVHEWHDKFNFDKISIPPQHTAIIGKFIDAIIAHSHTVKQEITKAFSLENQNKVFVVPHGNYIDIYENKVSKLEARKALGIPTENVVFLLFGNIYRYKGVLEAIDAFKYLPQDGISLLIAGQPKPDRLEELIKDKIQGAKNIILVPERVLDDEVQIYLNASDCVLLPYQVFTTSGAAILAMSFGRACIAPRVGFFSDVLDDSGAILYDSTDEKGLLQAMKCAIDKKNQLLDMGNYNLKVAEKWNWDYVAEETYNIYQKLSDSLR
ncbi:Group 1 glycosyl transferase [Hyella patelloides LEGE 07179]|uniref:Group 1 glycosyl transferase n=1 Tax=Hyella patelloides LEGE 07179 TaxID=945734 RepID=A0A563VR09_9CYAN|nr:glycosyltransferase family 4 protein [Hyella patelloides]VEP13844.1 Group 1 glycosyl transferase [Hyella patelloides LEGE 07179]